MIRFRITKNVIVNAKGRSLESYSKFHIIGKIQVSFNPYGFLTGITGYIVLERVAPLAQLE